MWNQYVGGKDCNATNFFGDTCDGGYGNVNMNINDLEASFVSGTSRPSK